MTHCILQWDTTAYGHKVKLEETTTQNTVQEFMENSKNYTFYKYDRARPTLDAAGTFRSAGESRKQFGSTFVNFSFTSSKGSSAEAHGNLAVYPDGGYDLDNFKH